MCTDIAKVNELLQKELSTKEGRQRLKYFQSSYISPMKIDEDEWNSISRVIVLEGEKETITGFLKAKVDRPTRSVFNLAVVNLFTPSISFGRLLKDFISMLFDEYQMNKIAWNAYDGNPIISSYRKLCKIHGGREVGVFKKHTELYDGTVADEIWFEILKEDWV